MLLEKEKIRRIIRDHKITSFQDKDEEELVDILYETLSELSHHQNDKLATKEDIKRVLEMMDKRFEAVDKRFEDISRYMDKRFEDINKRFNMMFTFMNIGFGILVLLTVLFKFLE